MPGSSSRLSSHILVLMAVSGLGGCDAPGYGETQLSLPVRGTESLSSQGDEPPDAGVHQHDTCSCREAATRVEKSDSGEYEQECRSDEDCSDPETTFCDL